MFGALLRTIVILVVVAAAVAFIVGYHTAAPPAPPPDERPIVGMTGRIEDRPARERATGRVATPRDDTPEALDASLTRRIRTRLADDPALDARAITVSAREGVITLEGTVGSTGERDRAVRLVRETEGVRRVTDRLEVLEDTRADERRFRD